MTKKTETKTEATSAPEPKLGAPMTPGKLRKFLQSRDIGARVEPDDRPITQPTRGMSTGARSPLFELERLAKPEEVVEFVEILRERRGADESAWMVCDNPTCSFVGKFRRSSLGANCPLCNFRALAAGGHNREMTDAEVADYQKAKAAKDADTRAQMERASLAARNKDRTEAGLPAWSLEDFRADCRRQFDRRQAEEARLQVIRDRNTVEKAERMTRSEPEKIS